LDVTGTQALEPICIPEATRSLYLLPPDRNGRIVLYHQVDYETERKYAQILSEHRRALIFYGLQLAASQYASLQNGFIFIQVRTGSNYKFYPEAQRTFATATKSCFPMTCKGVHIICTPKSNENIKHRFTKHHLPFIWKLMETVVPHVEHRTLHFITASSKQELSERLATLLIAKFGLSPDNLPELAGGRWNYKFFQESKLAGHEKLDPLVILPNDKEDPVRCNLSSMDASIWDFDMFLEPNKLCATTQLKEDKEDTLLSDLLRFECFMTMKAEKDLEESLNRIKLPYNENNENNQVDNEYESRKKKKSRYE
jgi:hypothetical protein